MNVTNTDPKIKQASVQHVPKDSEFLAIGDGAIGIQMPIQTSVQPVPKDSEIIARSDGAIGIHSRINRAPEPHIILRNSSLEVSEDNQSQIIDISNIRCADQKPPNISGTSLQKIQAEPKTQLYFGKKRRRPLSQDDHKTQHSMTNSIISQSSQQISSHIDSSSQIYVDCNGCKEYKVEVKRLQQTIIRITREAEAAKKRQDNMLSTSLKAQESMQRELSQLRINNVKLHIELTDVKAALRDIQAALSRCKFWFHLALDIHRMVVMSGGVLQSIVTDYVYEAWIFNKF